MTTITRKTISKTNRRIRFRILPLVLAGCFFTTACSEKTEVPAAQETQTTSEQPKPQLPASYPDLNDTGITFGADYPKDINPECSAEINRDQLEEGVNFEGEILPQQDCTRGRDVVANNDSDGTAGFTYQKINYLGERLATNEEHWDCVLDKVTGLMWEVKQPADGVYGNRGLHDADDLFTWYNSNTMENGGAIGDWNDRFNQCTGYVQGQPMTYCNIEEFASRVNKQGLCGFHDWRVPTKPELESLVNFGRTSPAIEPNYFPNTQNQLYWSNSATAGLQQTAWAVSFEFGFSAPMQRTNGRPVRLVRNSRPMN